MTTPNLLEDALGKCGDDVDSKRAVLDALMRSRVVIMLDRPWDGHTIPNSDMQMLFVTDGLDKEQAMLAIFTNGDRAKEFLPAAGPHEYPVDVEAPWAILGIPAGVGIMINPNQIPNFRITPEVAGILRDAAQKHLDQRIQKVSANPAK